LEHVAVDGGILWEGRVDILELGFLLRAGERDMAALPGGDALLECRVVQRTAVPQDLLQRTLLRWCGAERFLVGRAARPVCPLFAQGSVFSSGSTQSVDDQDLWLTPAAPHRQG
jgi:hypothetical protein